MHGGKDNYTYLTTAPIRRVIPTMAVPTIVGMLVTSLYVIADTFFVGQLDTQSTAAVGVVFPLMFFMQAFGFFFGHGSGNYIRANWELAVMAMPAAWPQMGSFFRSLRDWSS